MNKLQDLLEVARQLKLVSNKPIAEFWGSITFEGTACEEIFNIARAINTNRLENFFKVRVDTEILETIDEIYPYERNLSSFHNWSITLNKELLLRDPIYRDFHFNFFLQIDSAKWWIETHNFISKDNLLENYQHIAVVVDRLDHFFGSKTLMFIPPNMDRLPIPEQILPSRLPSNEKIQNEIHFITGTGIQINLERLDLTEGSYSSEISKALIARSCQLLALNISSEFYSEEKLIVEGIKRMVLKLTDGEDCTYVFWTMLKELILWLYEDRTSTRKKILCERFTLEINENDTIISGLKSHLENSFAQAKERYAFVIIDRKDAYAKELKDLLKDLRSQSDLMATKIRTILSNLLRDALAGIVLVWFTLFTKINENLSLDKVSFIKYVFYSLGTYYLISAVFQTIVDLVDVRVTDKELKYWKNVTKELIPDKAFDDHKHRSLEGRLRSLWILYIPIILLYIFISILCYKYPSVFHSLLNSDKK